MSKKTISPKAIIEIATMTFNGWHIATIADKFNVENSAIQAIRKGKFYKHVYSELIKVHLEKTMEEIHE